MLLSYILFFTIQVSANTSRLVLALIDSAGTESLIIVMCTRCCGKILMWPIEKLERIIRGDIPRPRLAMATVKYGRVYPMERDKHVRGEFKHGLNVDCSRSSKK